MVRGDAFLTLDFGLDIVDCVAGLDFEGDGLAGEGLDEAVGGKGWLVGLIRDGVGVKVRTGRGRGRGRAVGVHLHCRGEGG